MAAAYASLVSLMTVIDQIQHHPSPPITLDDQAVESLCGNITFLQEFLELHSNGAISEAADGVQSRIVAAAYAAEDVIESRVVDKILAAESATSSTKKKINAVGQFYKSLRKVIGRESTNHAEEEESINTLDPFDQSLQAVLSDFNLLKKEVMEIKERTSIQIHELPMSSSTPAGPVRYPSKRQKSEMVGFDDVLLEVLNKLTGHQSSLQIMPIVGMGGIGKTTLARNTFENQLIMQHFDFRSWIAISQEYNVREILLEVLSSKKYKGSVGDLSQKSQQEIGQELHKSLFGRRYLIIMDDMWSIEVWNKVKRFFPNNNNGSRIIITTRMFNMTSQLTDSNILQLNFLNEDQSWKLLCNNVFGEVACPIGLEKVGRAIAKNCEGLPLSITVISGLLAKSPWTKKSWEKIAKSLKSILHLEDDERCAKILRTSYDYLPIHLKPCFLYMGVFPEDRVISALTLMRLWVAEGFLKPIEGKSLDVVAKEYLMELVDRNLILVETWGFNRKIKTCRMHDLLRDMCLKEGGKEKFFSVFGMHNLGVELDNNVERRVIYHGIKVVGRKFDQVVGTFHSASRARSLIGDFKGVVPQLPFKLLRVLNLRRRRTSFNFIRQWNIRKIDFQSVNVRFLCVDAKWFSKGKMHLFWDLQTLIINGEFLDVPPEIWKMHQLKHVMIFPGLFLPDPLPGQEFGVWNLESLSRTINFKFSDEVIKRIPNIKKLKSSYAMPVGKILSNYCINNLIHFQKLESFTLSILDSFSRSNLQQNLNLPHSLKKLTLIGQGIDLHWEDVTETLGSLPLLQVLKLHCSIQGSEWNLIDGKFCNLRVLQIFLCKSLKHWVVEGTHFPCLEHIRLAGMSNLVEIPSSIGEIESLQSIWLNACSSSVITSAWKIQKEQEELGNFDLKIQVEREGPEGFFYRSRFSNRLCLFI